MAMVSDGSGRFTWNTENGIVRDERSDVTLFNLNEGSWRRAAEWERFEMFNTLVKRNAD